MYENKKVYIPKLGEEVHVSRIIASWRNRDGVISRGFKDWLKELGVDDYDIQYIFYFARNGKLELQDSAEKFLDVYTEYRDN